MQIEAINTNTRQLMKLREGITEGDSDKFALLMYSNIIQQNIQYVTNLVQQIFRLEQTIKLILQWRQPKDPNCSIT